jgi:hypothetical protein
MKNEIKFDTPESAIMGPRSLKQFPYIKSWAEDIIERPFQKKIHRNKPKNKIFNGGNHSKQKSKIMLINDNFHKLFFMFI